MSNIENDAVAMGELNNQAANNVIMQSSSSIESDNEEGKFRFVIYLRSSEVKSDKYIDK